MIRLFCRPIGNPGSRPKVNPYSVIDISPESPPTLSSPNNGNEGDAQEVPSSPTVPSGYSVPVPCGYATPSNVPIITPTYTTPVIIRHFSVDEEGKEKLISSSLHFICMHLCMNQIAWDDMVTSRRYPRSPDGHHHLITLHFSLPAVCPTISNIQTETRFCLSS